MVQCFAVLLILCFSGGSLGTTTSPQQQNTAKLKDLCEVRREKTILPFKRKFTITLHGNRLPLDSLLPFKYMYRLLHSYSCAIFNLLKLISYHINRKDTHIITHTVNIIISIVDLFVPASQTRNSNDSFSIAHFLHHRLLCSYKRIETVGG